jgi:hypothetical protein
MSRSGELLLSSRTLHATVTTLVVCLTFCTLASTQSTAAPPRSPKEVVEAYRKMDANGGRLTTAGWKKGNTFFLNPGPPPHDRVLGVMTGEVVGEAKVTGIRAEVWTDFDFLGKVYPTGRFSRSLGGSPPVKAPLPSGSKYSLILVDQHSGPSSQAWKIEDFSFNSLVTIDAAIRYLERLRDETRRDDIKRNAERSIAQLRVASASMTVRKYRCDAICSDF